MIVIKNILLETRICPAGYFSCQNSRCIKQSLQCDNVDDCRDGSDEHNCRCTPGEFRCYNGQCIKQIHR